MTGESILQPRTKADHIAPFALWWRRFFIRVQSWEYWPLYVFNIPTLFFWLWNATKARDLFFFTLTNPCMSSGGFFGTSKSSILNSIPEEYKPKTLTLPKTIRAGELDEVINNSGLTFPLIVKPEVGERGWMIEKVYTNDQLTKHLEAHDIDFILQEYIELPVELGIFTYAMPDGREAKVTSICEKHFLQIRGDGASTIGQLIVHQDRAVLQYEKLWDRFGNRWDEVLAAGEILVLEPIGNHCRGTMFLDRTDQIDEAITHQMIDLLKTMPGVFYGRFDLRAASWASLRAGKDFKILEFNGTNSDVSHIFQPGYSLLKAYNEMGAHWHIMYRIAKQNRRLGHASVTFKKIISALIIYFRHKTTN